MTALKQIPLDEIMDGNSQVILLHKKKHYQLSITRRGKLILTLFEGLLKTCKPDNKQKKHFNS